MDGRNGAFALLVDETSDECRMRQVGGGTRAPSDYHLHVLCAMNDFVCQKL